MKTDACFLSLNSTTPNVFLCIDYILRFIHGVGKVDSYSVNRVSLVWFGWRKRRSEVPVHRSLIPDFKLTDYIKTTYELLWSLSEVPGK